MADFRTLIIYTEEDFLVGKDVFIDSVAGNANAVIFEDDGETGYFYAVDPNRDTEILDALHIYNVADVRNKDKPAEAKISWTEEEDKAFLFINNYCHAVFDFENRAGYCRNGFPECNRSWARVSERKLTDARFTDLLRMPGNSL